METVGYIVDHLGIVIGILLGIISVIAIVRTVVKAVRGEKISIPAVGIVKDLPGSVTGVNKYKDDN